MNRKEKNKGKRKEKNSRVNIIVGEGQSESIYFQEIRRIYETDRVNKIDARGRSINYIKRRCIEQMNIMGPEDYLAIVIDVDENTPEMIRDLDDWCRRNNIDLYVSNPSFEVFLLMHFKDVSPSWSQADLEKELSSALGHKYNKSEGIGPTKTKVEEAIYRADKALPKEGNDIDIILERPARTNAHRLVLKLRELTSEKRIMRRKK